jgi:hypothetical protein
VSLADLQSLLWQLITAPEGVQAALDSDDPLAQAWSRGLFDSVRGDARLEPVDRLEIYANAYFQRILGCLKEDYGALAQELGNDDFHDLVTSYLAVLPPHHPSLRYAGERLPDFLASHPFVASLRNRWPWAADLALLEWAHVDAFDARDTIPAVRDDFEHLLPEGWETLTLHADPSVQILSLDWPVQHIRRAFDRAKAPPTDLTLQQTLLCVWRRRERVFSRELDATEAGALEQVAAGTTFGALCEQIARELGEARAPAQAAQWLQRWVEDELLARTVALPC